MSIIKLISSCSLDLTPNKQNCSILKIGADLRRMFWFSLPVKGLME